MPTSLSTSLFFAALVFAILAWAIPAAVAVALAIFWELVVTFQAT